MKNKKLILFSAGEIGEIAHYYFSNETDYEVTAFCLDGEYIKESHFCKLPVVPFEEVSHKFPAENFSMHVMLGYLKRNSIRKQKYIEAKSKGYDLASFVSRKASIAKNSNLGENCFIFEDNTIQPFTTIGNNVILWSGNHIGHHSTVGSHCFITSHVVVSGGVIIGESCFVGVNSTLRDHITIGDHSRVGMCANIQGDLPESCSVKTAASEYYVRGS